MTSNDPDSLPVEARARVAMVTNLPVTDRLRIASERIVPLTSEVRKVWLDTLPVQYKARLVLGDDDVYERHQRRRTLSSSHDDVTRGLSKHVKFEDSNSASQTQDQFGKSKTVAFYQSVIPETEVSATLKVAKLEVEMDGLMAKVAEVKEESRWLDDVYTTLVHYRARKALDAPRVRYNSYQHGLLQCRKCGFVQDSFRTEQRVSAPATDDERGELFKRLPLEVRAAIALGKQPSEIDHNKHIFRKARSLASVKSTKSSDFPYKYEGGRKICSLCGQNVKVCLPAATLPMTGQSKEWPEFHLEEEGSKKVTKDYELMSRYSRDTKTDLPIVTSPMTERPKAWTEFHLEKKDGKREMDNGDSLDKYSGDMKTNLPIITLPMTGTSQEWPEFHLERQRNWKASQLLSQSSKDDSGFLENVNPSSLPVTVLPGEGKSEWNRVKMEKEPFMNKYHSGDFDGAGIVSAYTETKVKVARKGTFDSANDVPEREVNIQPGKYPTTVLPAFKEHEKLPDFRLEMQQSSDSKDCINMPAGEYRKPLKTSQMSTRWQKEAKVLPATGRLSNDDNFSRLSCQDDQVKMASAFPGKGHFEQDCLKKEPSQPTDLSKVSIILPGPCRSEGANFGKESEVNENDAHETILPGEGRGIKSDSFIKEYAVDNRIENYKRATVLPGTGRFDWEHFKKQSAIDNSDNAKGHSEIGSDKDRIIDNSKSLFLPTASAADDAVSKHVLRGESDYKSQEETNKEVVVHSDIAPSGVDGVARQLADREGGNEEVPSPPSLSRTRVAKDFDTEVEDENKGIESAIITPESLSQDDSELNSPSGGHTKSDMSLHSSCSNSISEDLDLSLDKDPDDDDGTGSIGQVSRDSLSASEMNSDDGW